MNFPCISSKNGRPQDGWTPFWLKPWAKYNFSSFYWWLCKLTWKSLSKQSAKLRVSGSGGCLCFFFLYLSVRISLIRQIYRVTPTYINAWWGLKKIVDKPVQKFIFFLFFRHCEWTAFSFVFGYLFFFRTCAYYGFEKPPPHSNAIQLLITLRVIYSIYFLHTWYVL